MNALSQHLQYSGMLYLDIKGAVGEVELLPPGNERHPQAVKIYKTEWLARILRVCDLQGKGGPKGLKGSTRALRCFHA